MEPKKTLSQIQKITESIAHRFERQNPQLTTVLFGYASQLLRPPVLLSFARLDLWSDTQVRAIFVRKPLSLGSVIDLSEWLLEIWLRRHIPINKDSFRIKRIEFEINAELQPQTVLQLEMLPLEREAWLRDIFKNKRGERELTLFLWSNSHKRLGEVRVLCEILISPVLETQSAYSGPN